MSVYVILSQYLPVNRIAFPPLPPLPSSIPATPFTSRLGSYSVFLQSSVYVIRFLHASSNHHNSTPHIILDSHISYIHGNSKKTLQFYLHVITEQHRKHHCVWYFKVQQSLKINCLLKIKFGACTIGVEDHLQPTSETSHTCSWSSFTDGNITAAEISLCSSSIVCVLFL